MDSSGSRASRESIEGFSSEEDGDCDVFLSDSDSAKHVKENSPSLDRQTGLPVQDRSSSTGMGAVFVSEGPLARPQAFIPHPMSATHLKKPLENIYFASTCVRQRNPFPGSADRGRNSKLPQGGHLVDQRSKRFVSRGLKRRWEESRQHGNALNERKSHAKTRGDLLFAQKCTELQVFIRPLNVLLDGLKTGRYNKGLTSFQQSVAMDRIQRIVGVLQKPAMGERYLGTLLQVEMMLKVWFPHVTMATPSSEGSGPTGTDCSARKHVRTSSSDTGFSWESVSPASSRSQSFSDGGAQEPLDTATGRSREEGSTERSEPGRDAPGGSPRVGLTWLRSPGHPAARHLGQADGTSVVRCLALVMQDSSVSSTTYPHFNGAVPQPWTAIVGPSVRRERPARSISAPPCLPATQEGRGTPTSWPLLLSYDSIVVLDLRERLGAFGRESERPSK
ncbi:circadian-associated transcriptional repressor-like [Heterodontus francisci]|uniref:circadian-associated transcriptional repressor-like n=1 Tax=Heterodontus francisci TaxID=7792 RepID=UPI00355B33BA